MLQSAWRVMSHILSHPLNRRHKLRAMRRFLTWQIASRLSPGKIAWPFVENTRLLVQRGMTGATGNVYCGLHEFSEMALMLHALRPDDLFIDVGANVGTYTVLASGVVGARTIAFEPSPATFQHLLDNIKLNRLDKTVTVHNCAVGSESAQLQFTSDQGPMNHVVMERGAAHATVDVAVRPLRDIVPLLETTTIIKIDVEGYETEVINGAMGLLDSDRLLCVIMELNGSGSRYGFDDAAIHQRMVDHGFAAYEYEPLERRLRTSSGRGNQQNTVYVRDLPRIEQRVSSARRFSVLGTEF